MPLEIVLKIIRNELKHFYSIATGHFVDPTVQVSSADDSCRVRLHQPRPASCRTQYNISIYAHLHIIFQ